MRTCGHCGDTIPDEGHQGECWVIAKYGTQESLASPAYSDYATMRPVLSDADWHRLRDAELSDAERDANLAHPLA